MSNQLTLYFIEHTAKQVKLSISITRARRTTDEGAEAKEPGNVNLILSTKKSEVKWRHVMMMTTSICTYDLTLLVQMIVSNALCSSS